MFLKWTGRGLRPGALALLRCASYRPGPAAFRRTSGKGRDVLKQIDTRQLRVLRVLLEECSVTRAARILDGTVKRNRLEARLGAE